MKVDKELKLNKRFEFKQSLYYNLNRIQKGVNMKKFFRVITNIFITLDSIFILFSMLFFVYGKFGVKKVNEQIDNAEKSIEQQIRDENPSASVLNITVDIDKFYYDFTNFNMEVAVKVKVNIITEDTELRNYYVTSNLKALLKGESFSDPIDESEFDSTKYKEAPKILFDENKATNMSILSFITFILFLFILIIFKKLCLKKAKKSYTYN